MNIIGISAGYHDSACCLMQNGQIVAAAQEERFSRKKNDKAFPASSFRYCLDHAGLAIGDIDCVAFYEDQRLKSGRQIWMAMLPGVTQQRRASILDRILWTQPEAEICLLTGYDGPIEIVDHHLSHAASAYFYSGFEEAAILTVDGVGEWATTTYNSGRAADFQPIPNRSGSGRTDAINSLSPWYKISVRPSACLSSFPSQFLSIRLVQKEPIRSTGWRQKSLPKAVEGIGADIAHNRWNGR